MLLPWKLLQVLENLNILIYTIVIGKYKGASETIVYGVSIPGQEGKAGMVTILPNHSDFDLQSLYDFCSKNLAEYANPLFLRIQQSMQKTSTYKYTKVELLKQGFNPELTQDPLYFRDRQAGKYVPLDKKLYDEIVNGKLKL